ncbi:hypothetical protein ACFLXL_02140 [Chloroflexota bacterium]
MLFGWLIGFLALIWIIGFLYAVPIYIFAYMKIQGKYSWRRSSIFGVAVTVLVIIIFNLILGVVWPDGAIQKLPITLLGL